MQYILSKLYYTFIDIIKNIIVYHYYDNNISKYNVYNINILYI